MKEAPNKKNNGLSLLEKLQLFACGLTAPIALTCTSIYFLYLEGAAFFPTLDNLAWFYGYHAYFVSCLYIGLAILLFRYYFLRVAFYERFIDSTGLSYIGAGLVMTGLIASIYFGITG